MPELLVKTVRYLPNGNMLFEKRLYFLSESDMAEWRKKTNWIKGDKGRFAGSVPMGGGGALKKDLTNSGNGDILNTGKVYSFEEYDANPLLLGETTPQQKYEYFSKSGNTVTPLGKGNYRGVSFEDGGGFRVFFKHNKQLMLMYHPEERSHHGGAYYKLSNGGKPRRFFLDGTEKFD